MNSTDQPRPKGHTTAKTRGDKKIPWYVELFSRAGIESVVVVIILAMLFRTFEAEGFVIPTGSMAPSLHGRHRDLWCDQCGIQFQVGTALDMEIQSGPCVGAQCPNCRFPMQLNSSDPYHGPFSGDRIYVNKLAFQIRNPRRFEPIVFKYPGDPEQYYIKRLVGLPNETIRLAGGDVYVKDQSTGHFNIARKPASVLKRVLQVVHDTRFVSKQLVDAGYPASWRARKTMPAGGWVASQGDKTYRLNAEGARGEYWLHYRHVPPTNQDWLSVEKRASRQADSERFSSLRADVESFSESEHGGELISDFNAYNTGIFLDRRVGQTYSRRGGLHWVGDLALECEVSIESEHGQIMICLVEGGIPHQCRIDVDTGKVTVSVDDGRFPFDGVLGRPATMLTAETHVNGAGTYQILFANADNRLFLWIDGELVQFKNAEVPASALFTRTALPRPRWSPSDPGDLEPVRVGGRDIQLSVSRLRVLRDIYYIATDGSDSTGILTDYDVSPLYDRHERPTAREFGEAVESIFREPRSWATSRLFDMRRSVEFSMGSDEFFPLGDNSPESKDARIWHIGAPAEVERYVRRDMLVGSPFVIYWPHPWPAGTRYLPIIPNFRRFDIIQ